ncbi:AlbA family DNA-binding domain-containing protein [Streptomyces sp. NBC_01451]|uniref:AlbA family DNA-binding domain-containing protein n=1 Tax=Streptomyces sp. NBC_01451 TaxID=2903872 RepID=UPI002E35BE30|nr:ATP-binding protein [Streptomyces sp. NBC_01451]
MAYTSLHRSTGAQPGPVTAGMLDQAAAIELGEAEDLDWKRDADEVKDNREHAKDFAALANSQGGIIVTGVAETGTGGAGTVVGVDDARAQALADRFRGVANSMVRPFIPAFTVYTVALPSAPGRSVVVVQVPRSPEAPHLVPWDKDSWRYPKRVGSETVWLGESEMEAAYRRRFAARRDAEAHLKELAERLDPHLAGEARRVWVVVTAVCSVPAPYDTAPVLDTRSADPGMTEIFKALPESGGASLLRYRLSQLAPRVGLRRAVFTESRPYTGQCDRAYIELHHDGSFAGALQATSALQTGPTLLPRLDFESTVRDLVTAATVHAHRRGGDGMLQFLATAVTESGVLALANRGGQYDEQVDGSLAVRPEPVLTEAPLQDLAASPANRRTTANRLLLDLTHQFAVEDLLAP